MRKSANAVTCVYCEYFKQFEPTDNLDFFESLKGNCRKQNKICRLTDDICDYFALKSGLYTKKEYPNKENQKPTPFILVNK